MRRRIKKNVYFTFLACVCLVIVGLVWRYNLKSTVTVNYLDENGTPLTASKKIVGRINSTEKVYRKKIKGYSTSTKYVQVIFNSTENNYSIVYKPNNTKSFSDLLQAKYVGVSAQDVTTNSSGSGKQKFQAIPFGDTSNALRVIYSNNNRKYNMLSVNYPNEEIQDPTLTKFGNYWFVAYTGGILRTSDFTSWQKVAAPANKKFGSLIAPSLVKVSNEKLAMVFTTAGMTKNKQYTSYVAPFNYSTCLPNLQKAKKISGLGNSASTVAIYKANAHKYYALYTKAGSKDTGAIYVASAKQITGKYKVVKKITPPSGVYYYAPNFVLNQSAQLRGITYSSYYFDESNNIAYAQTYFKKNMLDKRKGTTMQTNFALQKTNIIQIK